MNSRREFFRRAGMAGIGMAGAPLLSMAGTPGSPQKSAMPVREMAGADARERGLPITGPYGEWAASLNRNRIPSLSLRRGNRTDLDSWRSSARERLKECMLVPDLGETPDVTVNSRYTWDGLQVEELSWQLPYGRTTRAILLKPQNAQGPLPGILAFYEHGAQKYFGVDKIVQTGEDVHPVIREERQQYYEGRAWANEIAKRGYVVLVPDVFPFGGRRVLLADVPEALRQGLDPQVVDDPGRAGPEDISAYNRWAGQHEHIMAKSLFSAGTTWPGVFFAEDRTSLDILCNRPDVDEQRVGCGGLSGGGIRTVYMAGLEPRIRCTVCAGFMTTWEDLVLYKAHTHTWMTYTPTIPNDLDFPEILGLRAPLPTLVLNADDDPLFTYEGMQEADRIMEEVFDRAGARESYRCSFHPGGHKFDIPMQEEAFEWFDRWLKD